MRTRELALLHPRTPTRDEVVWRAYEPPGPTLRPVILSTARPWRLAAGTLGQKNAFTISSKELSCESLCGFGKPGIRASHHAGSTRHEDVLPGIKARYQTREVGNGSWS